jgi:3-hydroxyisobutyrate dehydrogenase
MSRVTLALTSGTMPRHLIFFQLLVVERHRLLASTDGIVAPRLTVAALSVIVRHTHWVRLSDSTHDSPGVRPSRTERPDRLTANAYERVGYVGVGNMGLPMVRHLTTLGLAPVIYDVRAEAMLSAAEYGAVPVASPREVAGATEVVLVGVHDRAQADQVILGASGLLAGWSDRDLDQSSRRPLIVIHSTLSPGAVEVIAEAAAKQGVGVLDAPVSGGTQACENGTLTFMVDGAQADVERCRPYFDVLASKVFFIGTEPGMGQAVKLCNNIMSLTNAFATLEAAKLAAAYGIDEKLLVDVASVSTGDSWFVRNWGFVDETLVAHSGGVLESVQYHLTKDLISAEDAARERGVELPLVVAAAEIGPRLLAERKASSQHGQFERDRPGVATTA